MPADPSNSDPSNSGRSSDGREAVPLRDADHWHIERTANHLSIQFTTSTHQLRDVRLAVESFCQESGFDEKCWSEIGFVVNEAVANITRHAYDAGRPMPIDLNAEVTDEGVTITLRDWGKGEVPSAKNFPRKSSVVVSPIDLSGEPMPEPGGLGLVCMKELMNDIQFIPQHPGMLLRMTRPRRR